MCDTQSPIRLVRAELKNIYESQMSNLSKGSIHAGLLLDQGYTEYKEGNPDKSNFIADLCHTEPSELYKKEFEHWFKLTKPDVNKRFLQSVFKLENRLLIGLNGSSTLETGCMISHHNGMPYIPGSSIKGAVRHWAAKNLSNDLKSIWLQFFGSEPENTDTDPFSGLVSFCDAWWIPNSAPQDGRKPFTKEIVTSHHSAYYSSEGQSEATDMDSPIPNALIGVHGCFLFVLEGEEAHKEVVQSMLEKTLTENGIGAKTASGYGYFTAANDRLEALETKQKQAHAANTFSLAILKKDGNSMWVKLSDGRESAKLKGEVFQHYVEKLGLSSLSANQKKKINSDKFKVEVKVNERGNYIEITDIRLPETD